MKFTIDISSRDENIFPIIGRETEIIYLAKITRSDITDKNDNPFEQIVLIKNQKDFKKITDHIESVMLYNYSNSFE